MPTPVTKDTSILTRDTKERKPEWLKVRAPGGEKYAGLKDLLRGLDLHTVCEEASCPNVGECWGEGTATIMIMGEVCTRGCRFCNVTSGDPKGRLDPREPEKVAEALARLAHLKYVVITSVDRDDLPDGGAGHYARTVAAVKARRPDLMVETLIPDFRGDRDALAGLAAAGPEVIAQNQETVRRLTRRVRDARASYNLTLQVLADLKQLAPGVRSRPLYTKSSLMVGLGEREEEMAEAMDDLRGVGTDFLTIGQYLRPSPKHLPVVEFITPDRFARYREMGLEKGFRYVASGPLVRSSYRAGEFYIRSIVEGRPTDGARVQAPRPVGGHRRG
jgi:lipoic acid synthetase